MKKGNNNSGESLANSLESSLSNFGGISPTNDETEEQLAGLQLCTTKPVAFREEQAIAGLKATELLKKFDHSSPPLNPHFIFQNKMQHSGTRTIDALYKKLAYFNEFNYVPIENPMTMSNDRLVADTLKQVQNSGCADIIGSVRPSPLLVTKEHYWMNFTRYHLPHPTYIAIVRDPVDMFASNFYQCRFGDQGRPDYKGTNCKYMTKERLEMTIDNCVKNRVDECYEPEMEYFMTLCGGDELCNTSGANYQKKMLTAEYTKHKILNFYHVVGLLEDWKTTLELLEYMLPRYFSGSRALYTYDVEIQTVHNNSKSNNNLHLSESSRRFLKQGPLKYEMDLYKFIERLFYDKLDKLVPDETNITAGINEKIKQAYGIP